MRVHCTACAKPGFVRPCHQGASKSHQSTATNITTTTTAASASSSLDSATAIAATSSPQLATVIDRLMSLDIDDDEVYHISDVVGAVAEAKRAVAGATDTTAVMQEWLIIEDDIDQAEANRDDYLDEMDEQAEDEFNDRMNKAKAAASAVAHVVTDGDGDAADRALISAKVLSRAQQLDGLQRRHYSKADVLLLLTPVSKYVTQCGSEKMKAAVTNLSQQIQKEVLASSKQTSVLNFFRSSREHGVREEEALEEEETSDVEGVGVQDSRSDE